MNCINHPDAPLAAYCQNCGKPLCSACVRQVGGVTYCEPCLAARLGVPPAGGPQASATGAYTYAAGGPLAPGMPDTGPNPALATLLGFIPGVGAMYNGQFIKAFVHVLVFFVIITITNEFGLFGFFIPAWILYQVFDAHHTAKARRDGLPLPDPFGLNDLGVRLGLQSAKQAQPFGEGYPPYPPSYPPGVPSAPYDAAAAGAQQAAGYTAVPPVPPAEGYAAYEPPAVAPMGRPEPIGAIILIALGVLFLLGTMGIFHFNWIGHGWPLILIGVGIWIFIKRSRELPPGGGL